ncbi:MAG: hypothetical protein PUI10_08190, partial [Prevotellaceae bacterium]|nr:hypothetical protein [Prevotellaceae bacterium]
RNFSWERLSFWGTWIVFRLKSGKQNSRQRYPINPSEKNYDFTMFWSHITAFHGIAVKWFLRVY